jgi:hypothetical protein
VTKIPNKNNLRKEGFILGHGFRWFSSWYLVSRHLDRKSWQKESMVEEVLHFLILDICQGPETLLVVTAGGDVGIQ